MSDAAAIAALAAELADLKTLLRVRQNTGRSKRRKHYGRVNVRVTDEERDAIEAAAAARNLTVSDLVRVGLQHVLQIDIPLHRDITHAGRLSSARKKSTHFHDPKTARPETRERALAAVVDAGLKLRQAELAAAAAGAMPARIADRMLSESAASRAPKLPSSTSSR